MKIILRYLVNLIINLVLFLLSFFIILINLTKIRDASIILFQNRRVGFGNIFASTDLAQRIFKKDILVINFFDKSRFHNIKIFDFLNVKKIVLTTSLYNKNTKSRFGEYDNFQKKNKNVFQPLLIKIIKNLSKKKCKHFDILSLYDLSNKKFKKLKNPKKNFCSLPDHKWQNYYFYLINKNPKLFINKNNSVISNIISKKKKRHSICIYIRKKNFPVFDIKNFKLYNEIIRYFYKKKFIIYLTGEYSEFVKNYKDIDKFVELPEINSQFRNDINLAMQLLSEFYVGDSGGGSWFAMYKKKSVIIGSPEETYLPNVKLFRHKLYLNGKQIRRKSKKYKNIKKVMLKNNSTGDEEYMYKNKFNIKNTDNLSVLNYIKKNFR